MNIGFTGTQKGMTEDQKSLFVSVMNGLASHQLEFHHGDCVGADCQAVGIMLRHFHARMICHPPKDDSKRAWTHPDVMHEPKDYLVRNHDIVDGCDLLIATPAQKKEQLRSGTWATIRYARKTGKEIVILFPDGHFQKELR